MKVELLFWPKVNVNLFKDIVLYEAEKLLRNLSATMNRFSKNEAKPKIYQKLMTLISMQVQFPQIIVFSTSQYNLGFGSRQKRRNKEDYDQ